MNRRLFNLTGKAAGIAALLMIMFSTGAFAQYPLVTIDSIQRVSAANLGNCIDDSQLDGDTIRVRGTLVADGNQAIFTSAKAMFIQDGSGAFSGINVDNRDGLATVDIHTLVAGDSVEVIGVVGGFDGSTQLSPLGPSSISILGSGASIDTNLIAVSDLNDAQRNNNLVDGEGWEGTYVRVEDVTVTSVDFFSGGSRVSFYVADAAGNEVNISDRFLVQKLPANNGTFIAPSVGDQFNFLQGLVNHSKNNCPGASGRGFEIWPFSQGDYGYGPSAPRISNITRNPSAPNATQSVTISADIFDLDGTITSASMYYTSGATSTTFTQVAMNNTAGTQYTATIPAFSDGTFVKYYLEATDDSTNTTTIPNSNPSTETFFYTVRDNGLTIYDVQFTPFSNGRSGYTDQVVEVTGVVTASAKGNDLGYVYIQQENQLNWGGILVQGNSGLINLDRGDKVTITGTVEESFGFTRLADVSSIQQAGTGTIEPVAVVPDSLTSYSFPSTEQYEGMLLALQNGGNSMWVNDTNPDTPSNFGDYRLGIDRLNPNSGCRVLAGRVTNNTFSSLNFSLVNSVDWATNSGVMNVVPSEARDTVTMDTLVGILYYGFSNNRLLPRNNFDAIGINIAGWDTLSATVGIEQEVSASNPVVIFPNPAHNFLTVRTGLETGTVYQVKLSDINGREVFRRVTGDLETRFSLSQFAAGVYAIEVATESGDLLYAGKQIIK